MTFRQFQLGSRMLGLVVLMATVPLAAQLGLAFHIQALCLPMCRQQQRVHGLEAEAAALERQNAAMTMLLSGILSTGACPPAAASQDALEVWLATQLPGGC
ncbi:hypothetical protein APUTEX25_001196 [Auxenochlorella protothecoides]|uniref:Uncharacterized protein n=1 Tax=Auxenochlorella protothecoides TaxID=3075 RepID=A0A3M7KRS3_AUXPR|nr:hypothetical protein APUTEX25_001196 [Auxenochlorella protothecoides]|eukprot:RMZ53077.1 hypothetical protein APUTEX25_001196 [Auxenochlorella protothecoides]